MHPMLYWTSEMEAVLIDLIAAKPHLWDPRDKNYIRKSSRDEAFREIGVILKATWPEHTQLFTHDNMSHKFAMLKNHFRVEWKEVQRIRRYGGLGYESKWEHYARMRFLENVPIRRPKSHNLPDMIPMDISDDDSDDSEVTTDREELPGTSNPRSRLNHRPLAAEDGCYPRKSYQSSDESSNDESAPDGANQLFTDCYRGSYSRGKALSPADAKRKKALDLAFCRYLNTMLSPIPTCLQKELAKIKITEMILKLNLPIA